jgi:hypothetical protein
MIRTEVLEREPVALRGIAARWIALMLGGAFLLGVLLLLVQAALHKQLNHDENMYVGSGVLLREGQLPYRDYPYFQMPLLTLVYAAALWSPGDMLLGARLINTLCAFGTCLVLFLGMWFLADKLAAPVRALLGAAGVALYVSNPQLAYASGLAWNHDLPILLVAAGVVALALSFDSGREVLLLFVSGLLLGLAVSARLSFVAVLPLMVLFVLAVVPASSRWAAGARVRRCLVYSVGVLVGLLPSLVFLVADPAGFWFGNVEYHQLNEQFWLQSGYERAMTLGGKLRYLTDVLFGEPFNWLVVAGSIAVLLLVWRKGARSREVMLIFLPALAALALMVGALIPSPTWLQYFYAPYALLAFSFVFGVVYLVGDKWGTVSRAAPIALVTVMLIAVNSVAQRYVGLANTDENTPAQVEHTAEEIRGAVDKNGLVATLGPIYALQAGLRIYPELETGPFLPRVAPFLAEAGNPPAMVSGNGISRMLEQRPPDALLTGLEGGLEDPLVQFAVDNGYGKSTLSNGLTLWMKSGNDH